MASGNKKVVRRVKAKANGDTTTNNAKTVTSKPAIKESPAVKAAANNVAKAKTAKDSKQARRETSVKTAKSNVALRKSFVVLRPFMAVGRYIRDSWRELHKVEWPSRRATWKMTLGVILFCVFIGVFILICDWGSQWLIQEVIL